MAANTEAPLDLAILVLINVSAESTAEKPQVKFFKQFFKQLKLISADVSRPNYLVLEAVIAFYCTRLSKGHKLKKARDAKGPLELILGKMDSPS